MCGILGTINIDIKNKLDLITHRGPDSFGIEKFEIDNHKIIFGHRRLSILDLSIAGHQPMISECKNYILTFNGEIYNHLDLRKQLKNIKFKGHSDTETILYYLIKKGINGIKDFNGIYAFSFLDIKEKKIFIIRDDFGVKPIYYKLNNNQFIFSSELRSIERENKTQLDINNLATLLRLRYLPSPLTLHTDIQKVKPGHFITIDLSENKIKISETCFTSELPKTIHKPKNAVLEYGHLLDKAIKSQLMSDVEVGIMLSGGIDSAVVASIAQKYSKKPLKAFTIGFEGSYNVDEIKDAAETAEILGLDHYIKKINFTDYLSIFKETTRIIEEPLSSTSVIPMYYLSELASKHVKVVLTGQGADESLGGYQRYQGEILSQKIPRSIFKASNLIVKKLNLKSEKLIRASYSLGEKDDVKRFLNIYSIFTHNEVEKLLNVSEHKALDLISYYYNKLGCHNKINSVERMMAIDSRMSLSDDLLLYTDKITMNFGLECRVPMLDKNLMKYIESLPSNYRVKRGKIKIIHKKFAEQLLPKKIINRKKKGFEPPTKIWFRDYHKDIKNLLLSSKTFNEIFNSTKVIEILDQHKNGYNRDRQISLLLSIYYWLEQRTVKTIF